MIDMVWTLPLMHQVMDSFTTKAVAATFLLGLLIVVFYQKPKHLRSLRQKHVVITGDSSGIGFSLAKACLSEGAYVTLMSRTHSKLVSAHDTLTQKLGYLADHILLKAVDVSDAAAALSAIKESLDWRPIDVLICNAGQMLAGELDQAYFINFNIYTTTKFALKGLAEYLRIELMPYNILVSFACPGYTETMVDQVDKVCETSNLVSRLCFYERKHAQSPDDVAMEIIKGAKRGDHLITTNLNGFFVGVLGRGWMPADSITRAILELILLVPARIVTFVLFLHMKRVLQKHLQENLKESNDKQVPYIHSIDDSAADDDANLDLWSH